MGPSWETNSCSATQEIPSILWNPKVHYRVHKSPPAVPSWARWIKPTLLHPTSLRSMLILPSHLRRGLRSGLFPSCFPTKNLHALLSNACYMHWSSHPDLSITVIFAKYYKLWSLSLCNFLKASKYYHQCPVPKHSQHMFFHQRDTQIKLHAKFVLHISIFTSLQASPDSALGIATGYGLNGRGVAEPQKGQDFFPLHIVQTGSGVYSGSCPMDTGGLSPRG
jgi:hypothetical protein